MDGLGLWRAVRSAARAFGPDVVLSGNADVPSFGLPTVASLHDMGTTGWGRGAGFRVKRAARFAKLVVPTAATRAAMVAAGLDRWRVEVIPTVLRRHEVSPLPAGPRLQLVLAGRMAPWKGQHVAVEAVSRLHPAEKERVELHVVGAALDAAYVAQLRTAARGQPIVMHTDVDDISPFLRRAHVALHLASHNEGMPDPALEAFSMGRPAIWADTATCREALDGRGWPVPPDHPLALRATIRALLADRAPIREAAAAAQAWVDQRHERGWLSARWDEVLEAGRR
jgi:glycosyltransferase involved in cell wall biosynthesis